MHALLDRTIPITASRLQSWALLLDHMTVSFWAEHDDDVWLPQDTSNTLGQDEGAEK